MKKIVNSFFILSVSVVICLSCSREIRTIEPYNPESPMTKNVTFRADNAFERDLSVISKKNASRKFVPCPEIGTNCFCGSVTEDSSYYFIQPYNAEYLLAGNSVSVSVPYVQQAVRNGFDPSAYCLAGQSAGYCAEMLPFSRLVSFGLDVDSDINSITLRCKSGDILAGERELVFSNSVTYASGFNSAKKSRLTMYGVSNGSYGFVLPAGDLSSGISLEIIRNSDDRTASLQFVPESDPGHYETFDLGTIHNSDLSWKMVVPLRFVESVKEDELEWPFNESATPAASASFTTKRGGYEIKVDNFKGLEREGMKGFVFGDNAGDRIVFPAMQGLALNMVTLVVGADGTAGNPCLKNEAGKIVGSAWTGQKQAGDSYVWSFLGEHNVANAIELSSAPGVSGCAVRSLILSYRAAADQEYIVYGVETKAASDIDPKTGSAVLNAVYSASLDDPAKYQAGFQYRVKGMNEWTDVQVANPAQSGFSYGLSGIETEHFYEFRAYVKGETDIDTTYGEIKEFEISNALTLKLVFGDGTTSTAYYNEWNSLWGLKTGNSGVTGPVDKTYKKDDVTYDFKLYANHNIAYRKASSKYYGYCFDYYTLDTDPSRGWMLLPGVSGMKLTDIEIKLNTKGSFNLSSTVDANNTGDKLYTGGVNIEQKETTMTHALTLEGTTSGQRVYICSETRNITIMYLILKYKPCK